MTSPRRGKRVISGGTSFVKYPVWTSRVARLALLLVVASGCGHSEPFNSAPTDVGPSGSGSDVTLTLNPEQNYWPTLTGDSSAILYAFIDISVGGIGGRHRCMGAIPVAGGTRFWQWCDTRATQNDSSSSFAAFALGDDGRLLYVESVVPRLFPFQVPVTTVWLADSAAPFRRRALITLPVVIADSTISWLADLEWTGPNTFIGLGQQFVLAPHGISSAVDSVFRGEVVVRGAINDQGATLVAVPGTAGATGYSIAEDGASIVFTELDNANLMKVPAAGGVPADRRTGHAASRRATARCIRAAERRASRQSARHSCHR